MGHWHAFAWTGHEQPADSQAKDRGVAARPLNLDHWFVKPRKMHQGRHNSADSAYGWLEEELGAYPTLDPDMTVDHFLAYAKGCLSRDADSYTGYYTKTGRVIVRALLRCPREGVPCPD